MTYRLKIQDPSGETRSISLRGSAEIGRDTSCGVLLRDPSLPMKIGTLEKTECGFWLKMFPESPNARLGSLEVRETQLPFEIPVSVGETRFTLENTYDQLDMPEFPKNARHWLTKNEKGRSLLWMTKKAAQTPLSIYIAGETGSGKEVIAELIHSWSDRSSGPFVPLNCGALNLSLAESELFGHTKGAFTGADQSRPGALLQAHLGTLFLDEVGDLPMDLQVKLLRFLENGEIRPVGSDRTFRANVRLVCATHKPLRKLVEEGKFRRDLYYRIASVTLEIPALRERLEDIDFLSHRFASEFKKTISPRALLRLKAHSWPGNVRELRHCIERACGMSGPFEAILSEESFDFLKSPETIEADTLYELGSSVLTLDEMERVLILKSLRISGGNRAEAAKILGVARSTLFEMLKRHNIQGPKKFAA